MNRDIRWRQRFQNFTKALALLREPFARETGSLSDLEKEGVVQRFEVTFELAWKTLKDYLVFNGVVFQQVTPRNVIKQGFASKVISDGQLWIDMLDRRNLLADESLLDETVNQVATKFLPAFEQLFGLLEGKSK